MGKNGKRSTEQDPPVLTSPVAQHREVPLLTDAVVEAAVPVLGEAVAAGAPPVSPVTVAALREALTVIAQDLTRDCLDDVLAQTRAELERRLSGQFEEELRELIERALRAHLEGPG